ncbi:MAG: alpha/beta hydrolase [Candidatus Omnitrophica bacterium]|nr:alpha/beta hydrolase [Candidatus Omnitrophota bacterium]
MKLFIIILAIVVAFISFVRYIERKSIFFPDKDLVMHPHHFLSDGKDVYFATEDGVILNGWFFKNNDASATVLFFHGNAGNVSHRLEKVSMFYNMGLNVFIVDYRGYGRSGGAPSEQGLYRDARAAYDYLLSRDDVKARRIIGYGESLGGAVIIDLAQNRKFAALIVDSTFPRIVDMANLVYPYIPGFLLTIKMDSLSKIETIDAPTLFIHSFDDEIVPINLGKKLFDAAQEPKRFLDINGSHNDGYRKSAETYIDGIKDFLEDWRLI